MGKKLYVGNLPYSVTDADLNQLFASVGTVASATVIMDRMAGRSKGFGFVEMTTDEEASKALAELNGRKIGERAIVVSEARPQEDRPRGGGFGGGNRGNFGGPRNNRSDERRRF
jgi:RNA recognition motif-containing protein